MIEIISRKKSFLVILIKTIVTPESEDNFGTITWKKLIASLYMKAFSKSCFSASLQINSECFISKNVCFIPKCLKIIHDFSWQLSLYYVDANVNANAKNLINLLFWLNMSVYQEQFGISKTEKERRERHHLHRI